MKNQSFNKNRKRKEKVYGRKSNVKKDFKKVFKDIKNKILNAQYDIYKGANIRTLALYSYLGKIINKKG